MTSHPDLRTQKAVDVSGRLGSLYDAATDTLINSTEIPANTKKRMRTSGVPQIWRGVRASTPISYLERMGYSPSVRASILLSLVKPVGVSSLINYNQTIHEHTVFLYYVYRDREEELELEQGKSVGIATRTSVTSDATHIVSKIVWGFEILCVIALPDDQAVTEVVHLLQRIGSRLRGTDVPFTFMDDEEQQITQLSNVTVYGSETCIDGHSTSLYEALLEVQQWQKHGNFHQPLEYTMESLTWFYNDHLYPALVNLTTAAVADTVKLESLVAPLCGLHNYHLCLCSILPKTFASEALNQTLSEVHEYVRAWPSVYERMRVYFGKQLVALRRGAIGQMMFDEFNSNGNYSLIRSSEMKRQTERIEQLLRRSQFLDKLKLDNIRYVNVLDLANKHKLKIREPILKEIHCLLPNIDRQAPVKWSTDSLVRWFGGRCQSLYESLLPKDQSTLTHTSNVYLDFTDYDYQLSTLRSARMPLCPETSISKIDPCGSSAHPCSQPPCSDQHISVTDLHHPLDIQTPPPVTEINILLLGETGVGKSTFINAFVNYLFFGSIEQAEQNEPIVLIPVSFLTTVGDQFDEVTVQFGKADANEDHLHIGQSVTQQCKSYLLPISERLRLRFIDTPGMGDSRGVEQDDRNIHHILSYIHELPHLNAVCLLLKPNASRLNIFFRTCVQQLLTYLTPIAYENILFCFTNSRATFFAPGDTGPLLRKMLEQEAFGGMSFKKENTFCFDSESFRYLAARRCLINFDEFQAEECRKSWTKSVDESRRLLQFIESRTIYSMHEWQSPRKCCLEISTLARPLMEAFRVHLYNWALLNAGEMKHQVKLKVTPNPVDLCFNCAQTIVASVGPFEVVQYASGNISDSEHNCCRSGKNRVPVEYFLEHLWVEEQTQSSTQEMDTKFDGFLLQIAKLAHFFRQHDLSQHEDPFETSLDRFLHEEECLDASVTRSNSNAAVKALLHTALEARQRNYESLRRTDDGFCLDDINQIIAHLTSLPDINDQYKHILSARRSRMNASELQVSISTAQNDQLS